MAQADRAWIGKILMSPGIDSLASIPGLQKILQIRVLLTTNLLASCNLPPFPLHTHIHPSWQMELYYKNPSWNYVYYVNDELVFQICLLMAYFWNQVLYSMNKQNILIL